MLISLDKPIILLSIEEVVVLDLPCEKVFVFDEPTLLSPNIELLFPLDSIFDLPDTIELVLDVELLDCPNTVE